MAALDGIQRVLYVLWVLGGVQLVMGSLCTDACDRKYAAAVNRGKPVTICGTDGITHSFNHSKWAGTDPCYPRCGVSMLYAGRCGCPNDCMKHMSYGSCQPHPDNARLVMCHCKLGWGGPDCSQIRCPNLCSGKGHCVTGDNTNAYAQGDYCECEPTHTGYDCSTQRNGLLPAPYGNVFDDVEPFIEDPYGDNHPIFDLQLLCSIRLTVAREDLAFMLAPVNTFTSTHIRAHMQFDNGVIRQVVGDVGLRTTGQWSRYDMKKSYEVSFNKFSPDQRFFGIKTIGFKGASSSGDNLLKDQLAMELARAAVLPAQRSSFGVIWINDIFMGLYWATESLDDLFVNTRFGYSGGNLYKMNLVSTKYEGPYPDHYAKSLVKTPLGLNVTRITQLTGNGDFSDLPELLRFISYGDDNDGSFQLQLAARVNIERLLRWCIVESFVQDQDGFAAGNNYALYHNTNPNTRPPSNYWELLRVDFDNLNLITNIDALDFWVRRYPFNELVKHVFTSFPQMYLDNYGQFLAYTFGAQSPSPPPYESVAVTRYKVMKNFLQGWYARDFAWQTSNGCYGFDFTMAAGITASNLPKRFNNLQSQVSIYIPPIGGTGHDGGSIVGSSSTLHQTETGVHVNSGPPVSHKSSSSAMADGSSGDTQVQVLPPVDMSGGGGGVVIAVFVALGALAMMLDSCGLLPKERIAKCMAVVRFRVTGRTDSAHAKLRPNRGGDDDDDEEEGFRSLESRVERAPRSSDYVLEEAVVDDGNSTEDERRYANRNNDEYRSPKGQGGAAAMGGSASASTDARKPQHKSMAPPDLSSVARAAQPPAIDESDTDREPRTDNEAASASDMEAGRAGRGTDTERAGGAGASTKDSLNSRAGEATQPRRASTGSVSQTDDDRRSTRTGGTGSRRNSRSPSRNSRDGGNRSRRGSRDTQGTRDGDGSQRGSRRGSRDDGSATGGDHSRRGSRDSVHSDRSRSRRGSDSLNEQQQQPRRDSRDDRPRSRDGSRRNSQDSTSDRGTDKENNNTDSERLLS